VRAEFVGVLVCEQLQFVFQDPARGVVVASATGHGVSDAYRPGVVGGALLRERSLYGSRVPAGWIALVERLQRVLENVLHVHVTLPVDEVGPACSRPSRRDAVPAPGSVRPRSRSHAWLPAIQRWTSRSCSARAS